MSEILLLNPRKKTRKKRRAMRKTTRKKTARKTTARKTTARKTTARKKASVKNPIATAKKGGLSMAKRKRAIKRRAPRRNPSRARRVGRAAAGRAFGGLNFKTALKNIPVSTIGMFAAKWAAKRFGEAASETDPNSWNYASYLKGSGGAAAAAIIANMVKPGSGQRVLEGGMSLMLYKLVQNELIAPSEFWGGQFGQSREPGVIETNSEGEPYILGEDYEWYPLTENSRMQGGYGDSLVTPGPLGDSLVTPGPLGATMDQRFVDSFLRR